MRTEGRVKDKTPTQSSALVTQTCFCLSIADITIAVASNDPGLTVRAEGATKKFVVDEADPDVRVRAAWGDVSNGTIEPVRETPGHAPDNSSPSLRRGEGILPRPERERAGGRVCDSTCGEKIFDSGALWQLYHHDSVYHFRFASSACGPLPYKVACFNLSFTSGEVYLHHSYFDPKKPVYPLEYPLDELLMINLLGAGRGVEVHACGIIDPLGNGYLFAGQSGAGKTTMAKLWQRVLGPATESILSGVEGLRINSAEGTEKILSDDRIIIRKVGNRLWMYGTPWHGEAGLSCPARAPLKQIFLLRHGNKNDLLPVGGAEAASRLFACSFPSFYSRAGLDFSLSFLEEVVRTIPCYELSFVPDERVVGFILGGI